MPQRRTRRPDVCAARSQAAFTVAVVLMLSCGLLTCNLWMARAGGSRAEAEVGVAVTETAHDEARAVRLAQRFDGVA